ncbi:MAG: hypothetical protein VW806_05570 [Halieaceae bacterium]
MSPEARDTGVLAIQSTVAVASGVQGCCVGLITTGSRKTQVDAAAEQLASSAGRAVYQTSSGWRAPGMDTAAVGRVA